MQRERDELMIMKECLTTFIYNGYKLTVFRSLDLKDQFTRSIETRHDNFEEVDFLGLFSDKLHGSLEFRTGSDLGFNTNRCRRYILQVTLKMSTKVVKSLCVLPHLEVVVSTVRTMDKLLNEITIIVQDEDDGSKTLMKEN